jgi:hypothetical protein
MPVAYQSLQKLYFGAQRGQTAHQIFISSVNAVDIPKEGDSARAEHPKEE